MYERVCLGEYVYVRIREGNRGVDDSQRLVYTNHLVQTEKRIV